MCERDGLDPVQTFREEVRKNFRGEVKGPFNVEAREKAGMTREFYEDLRGEMGWEDRHENSPQVSDSNAAQLQVGYETLVSR